MEAAKRLWYTLRISAAQGHRRSSIQLGVTFPQTEIGADPGAVRAYAQAVEEMGFDYLLAYDHVLGADVSNRQDWNPVRGGPPTYNHTHLFHEPFVLFGFLAGITKRLHLATGVLIVGQRQTALVAKQAAEIDVLSGGRLRLGIGAGWNDVEFEALGMEFHNRGRRNDEQIALLRALWTQEVVTFEGQWDKVTAAGINPLPVQRPIPIWIGGGREPVLKRAGRLADGVFLNVPLGDSWETIAKIHAYAREAGRDPSAIGIESMVQLVSRPVEHSVEAVRAWEARGGTHMSCNTMNAGLSTADQHIDALRLFKQALDS